MFMMIQKSDIPLLIVEAALEQVVRSQLLVFIASKVRFDSDMSGDDVHFVEENIQAFGSFLKNLDEKGIAR